MRLRDLDAAHTAFCCTCSCTYSNAVCHDECKKLNLARLRSTIHYHRSKSWTKPFSRGGPPTGRRRRRARAAALRHALLLAPPAALRRTRRPPVHPPPAPAAPSHLRASTPANRRLRRAAFSRHAIFGCRGFTRPRARRPRPLALCWRPPPTLLALVPPASGAAFCAQRSLAALHLLTSRTHSSLTSHTRAASALSPQRRAALSRRPITVRRGVRLCLRSLPSR